MECPSEEDLIAFAREELAGEQIAGIQLHIQQCELCSEAIAWWEHHLQSLGNIESSDVEPSHLSDTNSTVEELDSDEVRLQLASEKFNFERLDPTSDGESLGRLGRFDVRKVVGVGAMGVVFRCWDTKREREVALKVLAEHLANDDMARRRFKREARAVNAVKHANVVRAYGWKEIDGLSLLVLEYVDGVTLRRRIDKRGPMSPREAVAVIRQVACGLQVLHNLGVYHRDVKPTNILLTRDGVAKLTDFGLVRTDLEDSRLTASGMMVGTPAFMSPEQVEGEPYDQRSDLFCLGGVLFFLLTGKTPFRGKLSGELSFNIAHSDPRTSPLIDACPADLKKLVYDLLQKSPAERPQSAEELLARLDEADLTPPPQPDPSPAKTIQEHRPVRRGWVIGALAATFLLLCVAGFAWFGPKFTGPSRPLETPPTGLVHYAYDDASLAKALAEANAGDEIKVLNRPSLLGPLKLTSEHAGLTLDLGGAEVTADAEQSDVIHISSCPGLTLRNGKIEPRFQQHGLAIEGDCGGLRVESITIRSTAANERAGLSLQAGAEGQAQRPIQIDRCRFESGRTAVALQGSTALSQIRIFRSRFIGSEIGLDLTADANHVVIRHCCFQQLQEAVRIRLNSSRALRDVAFVNNTIVDSPCCLNVRESAASGEEVGIRFDRNLIVHSKTATIPERWDASMFRDNWWWTREGSLPPITERIARWRNDPQVERRGDSVRYMHPLEESPLLSALDDDGTIGAYPLPE